MNNTQNHETQQKNQGSMTYVYLLTLIAALGGMLFGYDTGVIAAAEDLLVTRFNLSSTMEGWTVSCALIGCMIGVAFAGFLSDRFGRKKVLILSAIFFFASAVGTALPRDVATFILFRMLGGLAVGAASMTSPLYIAEISPAKVRGRMVSINQFAIVTGFVIVYFINYFIALQGDQAWNEQIGWRWMFGSEALPAILLLLLLIRVPESPRWLTKQNREDEALEILSRISGSDHAQSELNEIKDTISQESGSLRQLLEPGMKIVLVIGVILAVLQQITGINVIMYYGPKIFKTMGFKMDIALLWQALVGAIMLSFTLIAIWTVDKLGRKFLMIIGTFGMGLALLSLGLAFFFENTGSWAILFVFGYIACFSLSIGPVVWVVLSEIFPTRIRGRAMGIATLCLWFANYVISQTFPMMNDNAWLIDKFHHAFPFWIYSAMCAVMLLFVWRFVPETKGKTLEEIEHFWKR